MKWGLRHRLMMLYALMALVPTLLGIGVLLLYLHSQVRKATSQFQRKTAATLQRSQHAVEAFTQQQLQRTFAQMEHDMRKGLESHQRARAIQQEKMVRQMLAQLRQRMTHSNRQLQQTTHQTMQRTLNETAQRIGTLQTQAMERLTQTTTAVSRDAIRAQVGQSSLSLTLSLSRQVDAVLQNTLTQLTLIAQQPALREMRLQESRWILQSLQDREPAYRVLCLRDITGEKLVSVGSPLTPSLSPLPKGGEGDGNGGIQNTIESLWQQMVQSGEPVIGQVLMLDTGAGKLEPVLPVFVPVRERGVELRGAVGALIGMDEINRLIRGFRLGKQGYALLCTMDGLILAHPDPRQIGQRDPRWAHLTRSATEMETLHPRMLEQQSDLITLTRLPSLNAFLLVIQPREEAFQLASTLQEQFARARHLQQSELRSAIQQVSQQAARQIQRQMARHQHALQQTLIRAEQQTLLQAQQQLTAQSNAQQQSLVRLLNANLQNSQSQLQRELRQQREQSLQQLHQQFAAFASEIRQRATDQVINAFLIVLLGIGVFSLLGSFYLYRILNLPLKALMEATQAFARGELNHRVQLPTRDGAELEQLANAFNHMADALAKAEAQLVQTSKLASLGTLASGVAHELNQPLAIIRGIAQQTIQMLSREGGLPPAAHPTLLDDLRLIERQTQRMSQIIMHLRTFARKPRTDSEPVNLNEVAQNALILLREQLHQRGIELVEEYAPNLPPVLGEPNALEQVVINLLTNARDALENQPDGQVIIRTRTVRDGEREWVELCVQDNGPGIPADLRSQIFDPFFTTKEPGKGTGLGLAISLEIAQKHGGTLQLGEPSEGRGALFILRLPASAQTQQAA
jgi:C4-dicarboxylate-specific signal transduction histidine kinase